MQATDTHTSAGAGSGFPARRQAMFLVHACLGVAVIVACLEAGIELQQYLRIPVPGSVLGMVLLLVLLQTEVVPDAWVQGPCAWLLLVLPALFVPIYAVALSDPAFWRHYGQVLLPAALVGVAVTLTVTGWLAWRVRRQ